MPNKIYPTNGLAALRKSRGYYAKHVAKSLGVTYETLYKWERADMGPSKLAIPALAVFYGVPVEQIKEAVANVQA